MNEGTTTKSIWQIKREEQRMVGREKAASLIPGLSADQRRMVETLATQGGFANIEKPETHRFYSESPSIIAKASGLSYNRAKAVLAELVEAGVVFENHPTPGRSTFRLFEAGEREAMLAKRDEAQEWTERVAAAMGELGLGGRIARQDGGRRVAMDAADFERLLALAADRP